MKHFFSIIALLTLLHTTAPLKAASLDDLKIMQRALGETVSQYGPEQVADLVKSSSSPSEKSQLIRIEALFSLLRNRNEANLLQTNMSDTYPSENLNFIGPLVELDTDALKIKLETEIQLLASTLIADEEKSQGHTIHTLDSQIFVNLSSNNTSTTQTPQTTPVSEDTTPNTPKADNPDLPFYTKLQQAIKNLDTKENANIMLLAKASFETDKPILQGALVRVGILGFIKNKYSKTNSFISNVNTKIDPGFTSFTKGDAFYKTCTKCAGSGDHIHDCKECDNGKCTNAKCKNGLLVYKGLGNKLVKKPCPTCKGSKNCMKCAGTGSTATICTSCNGKGRKYTTEEVPAMFDEAVTQLSSIIEQFINTGTAVDELTLREQQATETKRLAIEEERRRKADEKRAAAEEKIRRREEAAKQQAASDTEATEMITLSEEDINNKGRTPDYLTLAVEEVVNYIQAQQRRTGVKLAMKVLARPPEDENKQKTTLYLTASEDLINTKKDVRDQIIDGLYQYWSMRCQSNGVSTKDGAQLIVRKADGTTLSVSRDGETTYP